MDNATIIELFKRQDENIDKMGKEIKEFVGVSMSLNRAKFINELDPIKNQLDEIVDQNKIRNHRIEKSEDCIKQLEIEGVSLNEYHLNCPANKMAERMQKKWFWVAVGITFALSYFILEAVYNGTGLGSFIADIFKFAS